MKDILTEEANEPQAVATLVPLEESSKDQQAEELSSENNLDANKEIRGVEMPGRSSKSEEVLMSDEELAEALKKEAKEEQEVEERQLEEEEEAGMEEGEEPPAEVSEDEEETLGDKLEMDDAEEEADEDEELIEEDEKESETLDKEEVDVEMMPLGKHAQEAARTEERRVLFEDGSDGSSESELPADLDYAADSGLFQVLQTSAPPKQPEASLLLQPDGKEQHTSPEKAPTSSDESEREAADGGQASEEDEDGLAKDASAPEQDHKLNGVTPDLEESSELFMSKTGGKAEEKSGRHSKRNTKKQKKNHRVRKHFPQSEQPQPGPEASRRESESSSAEDTGSKAKRRRAGKWVQELSAI